MSKDNEKFGSSPGPYKPIEGLPFTVDLKHTGLNFESGPMDIEDTEAVQMDDMRVLRGGITPDFAFGFFKSLGALSFDPILHIASFEKRDKTKIAVRMRANVWEWWNGSTWLDIGGAVGGLPNVRMYSTVMDNKLIVANGKTRLKRWLGGPLDLVEDLSAEAPSAFFVTRIGNRLLVANGTFNLASDPDPDFIACSADGDIAEWTDASLGAISLFLKPEGNYVSPNYIRGLSNIERGTLIYRQRSLVLCSRTGVRAAPFRFATIDYSHGTESPYAIVNGGPKLGDFFLGYDHIMYHFDGQNEAIPIGLPIQRRLEDRISNLSECVAYIDPSKMDLVLLSPKEGDVAPFLSDMHIFSLREYLKNQKLCWRYRDLSIETFTDQFMFGGVVTTGSYIPGLLTTEIEFVDSFNTIPDDIVDPTDPAFFVGSAVNVPAGAPPTQVRWSIGLWGLPQTQWGTQPTPDTLFADSNGTSWVATNGYIDKLIAAGARTFARIHGGSNTDTMVNFPAAPGTVADRNFSVSKWITKIDEWVGEVRGTVSNGINGEVKLRAAVKSRNFLGIMGFDDFLTPGTTGNAYTNGITFEQIEQCSQHLKNIWPWMPIIARGVNWVPSGTESLKGMASLPGAGTRINGIRQYQYLDAGLCQWRAARDSPTSGTPQARSATYYANNIADGVACGLGTVLGMNILNQGKGDTPGWGCPHPDRADQCGASPTEILGAGLSAIAATAGFGWFPWAYSLGYTNQALVQAALMSVYNTATSQNRAEALLNIRGDLVAA